MSLAAVVGVLLAVVGVLGLVGVVPLGLVLSLVTLALGLALAVYGGVGYRGRR